MQRILYVEPSIYTSHVGGAFISLFHMLNHLDRDQYRPTVLFFRDHDYVEKYAQAGIEVIVDDTYLRTSKMYTFCQEGAPSLANRVARKLLRVSRLRQLEWLWRRDVYYTGRIRSLIRDKEVALVHTNEGLSQDHAGILAARLEGVPAVCHERRIDRLGTVTRYLSGSVACSVAISRAVADSLIHQKARSRRILTVYNGVDVEMVSQAVARDAKQVRNELRLGPSEFVVGMFGSIIPWKGQDVFLRAVALMAKHIPELRVLIVGGVADQDREYYEELQGIIRTHGLESIVTLTGYRADVYRLMGTCSIVAHASVKPEPFGRVIAEAQAAGALVIASNEGGARELVKDGETGYLTAPGDYRALAGKVVHLYNHPAEMRQMTERGQRHAVSVFDIRRTVSEIQRLYQDILAK